MVQMLGLKYNFFPFLNLLNSNFKLILPVKND